MRARQHSIIGATITAGTAVLLYFLPLFHVVPLHQASAAFDAVTFVDHFWTERLIPARAQAVDAAKLVADVHQDPKSARLTHGRKVGLGAAYYYFVAGSGHVVSVQKDAVGLSLRDSHTQVQVWLETGKIFGNAVRDGTGLLNVNDIPNSQDFNAVSSELNRRIEVQVLPALRKSASVGAKIRFVGCAQISDEDTNQYPLRIVAFIVETP